MIQDSFPLDLTTPDRLNTSPKRLHRCITRCQIIERKLQNGHAILFAFDDLAARYAAVQALRRRVQSIGRGQIKRERALDHANRASIR